LLKLSVKNIDLWPTRQIFVISLFLLIARYVPNVAKRNIWDQRPTTDLRFRKSRMAISQRQRRVIRSISYVVLEYGFRRRQI